MNEVYKKNIEPNLNMIEEEEKNVVLSS